MYSRYLLILLSLMILSCEPGEEFLPDNPLDPDNTDYIRPQVTFVSVPSEGSTLSTPIITIEWEGNQPDMSYRYALNGKWNPWELELKSITIEDLDEQIQLFEVQSQYSTGDTSDVISANFNVNAVFGPSLLFYPRKHEAFFGEQVTFQILAEEVVGLAGAEFTIEYDPLMLKVESITEGSLFESVSNSLFHVDHNSSQGTFTILTAILDGKNPTFQGTGPLVEIVVTLVNKGTSTLRFTGGSKIRGSDNTNIEIRDAIGGIVIAK